MESLNRNPILVTGAHGFVGSVVCDALRKSGRKFTAVSRTIPQGASGSSLDLTRFSDWDELTRGHDSIIHLAARVHVMRETSHSPLDEFREANLVVTQKLAEAAARNGVRRFVFASTIKVNGEWSSDPFFESDVSPPHDPYALSKWEAEQALWKIAARTGLEVVVLRPPLMYGPGVKGNFFSLMRALSKEMPLPLASFSSRRSLLFVENFSNAILHCLDAASAAGKTLLVRDGEDVTVAQLCERLASDLGKKPRLFPFPSSLLRLVGRLTGKNESVQRLTNPLQVDDRVLRDVVGWTPPFSLDQGLRVTCDWFKTT